MIIDITTGFFPCTGYKPGCPCVGDNGAGVLECTLYGHMKGRVGRLATLIAEQTVARVKLLAVNHTASVTWGFPVTKPVLQERLQHANNC